MIKVEFNYFQKLIMSSCKGHFALSESVVYLVLFIIERKTTREENISALLVIFENIEE